MSILANLSGPSDLRDLDDAELTELAAEIRELLIVSVASNGGHLGPNLGVVELGIAIHRVFESPSDRIVWDTGHQSYVHKMLTGRAGEFETLRREGGLSGYPSRSESEHDWVENSHASTSLSYADGMAKANLLLGKDDYVVAVIGDGALTGGMAWEALNNIAADSDRRLIAIVNDNGRSYTPTVGGLANRLTEIRTNPRYEPTLSAIKDRLTRTPFGGARAYEALHAIKKGVKDALAPQGMFEDLGLKYIGPVDGHDRESVEHALERAKTFGGPVLVHVLTTKGHGYDIAVANENDQMHQANPFDRATGDALSIAPAGWTSVFRDEIVRIADERPDVVGITAAMLYPVGLDAFADKFPDRVFDVGIAEQHAVTSAAGLAMGGLHPVVAVYATFINRAFDQVLLDVALHGCGVTFVLDRAGVTGDDGASHNGMWDMSLLQIVPGIRIAAPRDGARLRELLREAVDVDDAPTVVRFAKGAVCDDLDAVERVGATDVLSRDETSDVLVVAVGAFGHLGVETAELLRAQGLGVTVVDPRWVKPVDPALVAMAADHRLVVTIEDNGRHGGVGSAIAQAVRDAGVDTPVQVHGVEQEFLDHAKRDVILGRLGLTARSVADDTLAVLARNSADG
ncbi:1-deoxy-D-xylulose-5-phosphate synthase [Aeromicrobium sp. Root472D3]|uniref:1-deoxy-D-xylulose-5-phosphate synthase n=1 Tax=unclassified Aeromicrobium TaxID=2633570 RepID=UPI0006F8F441|nr:1-deoxy-D-xylulose-5-phosphate synthase [Aeromicrobium sp. Root472D3]KQX75998.1 1-deoxy-D-xylulose-5-phosphate synthase [Aeromicrobium sp. Root472D3]MBD8606541.1 1-deoxy-D-xylulose-5-phosphate synthase [Aeromicrobium sp. CFBP 8757]